VKFLYASYVPVYDTACTSDVGFLRPVVSVVWGKEEGVCLNILSIVSFEKLR